MSGQEVRPTSGRVRLLRVGVLGGLSLLLAGGAHLAGGGELPGPGVLAVAAVLLGLVATLVTARRCRFAVLALLLAGQQALLHTLFTVAGSAAHVHLAPGHHDGTAHALPAGLSPDALHVAASGPAMDMAGSGWAMWVGHAAATLATAWLLAHGEAWLWRTTGAVVAAAALGRAPRVWARPAACARPAYARVRRTARVWCVVAPRGPPVASVG